MEREVGILYFDSWQYKPSGDLTFQGVVRMFSDVIKFYFVLFLNLKWNPLLGLDGQVNIIII